MNTIAYFYSNSRLSNIFNGIRVNFHLQLKLVIKRMISLQSMHHILMNDAELLKCLLIHLNFYNPFINHFV